MSKLARILGVSGAFAGVVLATATSASAQSSASTARVPVVRVSAAGQASAVAKGITAIHARPAVSLAKPGGYTLVESVQITLNAGSQTFAFLSCPKKNGVQTVPLNGGAEISSSDLAANINSSYPYFDGKSWAVDANNGSSSATFFNVYVVCVKKIKGYVQLHSNSQSNPAETENAYGAVCPSGSKVFGGGALSSSTLTSVNLTGNVPVGHNEWAIYINNASTSSAGVTIYVICAKPPSTMHYTIVSTAGFTDDAGTEEGVTQFCPSGYSVLGGGLQQSTGLLWVNINSTFPITGEWRGYMNNASTFDVTVTIFAICGV
jgi:hypothetical protein